MVNLNPYGDGRTFASFIPDELFDSFFKDLQKSHPRFGNLFGDAQLLMAKGECIPFDRELCEQYVAAGGCYFYCIYYLNSYCWTLAKMAEGCTDVVDLADIWDGFAPTGVEQIDLAAVFEQI